MPNSELSIFQIENAESDDDLFDLLSGELARLANSNPWSTMDGHLEFLKSLPIGLRSMASVYDLDVSMTLDDLGWHFLNWHSLEFAQETLNGLRELEALKEAEIFEQALGIAKRHWTFIESESFQDEYLGSPLDQELSPLNGALWEMMSSDNPNAKSLLSYWAPYARKHPHLVVLSH